MKKISRRNFIKLSAITCTATTLAVGCSSEKTTPAEGEQIGVPSTGEMALLMDTSLCVECQACRVACQNENSLPVELSYIRFDFIEYGEYPKVEHQICRKSCMHCTDAPCVEECPVKALYKGEQGFTHLDYEKCIGCGMCARSCPYDVPTIHEGKMYKCIGCPELINDGKAPACASTCLANAVTYGPIEEMIAKAEERVAKIKNKYPDANVYGLEQMNGLNLLLVLRRKPSEFDLI